MQEETPQPRETKYRENMHIKKRHVEWGEEEFLSENHHHQRDLNSAKNSEEWSERKTR
jgi:hypothetical protein